MVALFFYASPNDLNDYEDWLQSDYERYDEEDYYAEYNDYYNDYDEYEKYTGYKDDFIKPIFFDNILKSFVDNLSEKEMKGILIEELKKNEKYTFNTYLKKEYEKYISNKNDIHAVLELVNNRFCKLLNDYNYNYNDYSEKLLTKREKKEIINAYNINEDIKNKIDKIFLNPKLAIYDGYRWIAFFYKKNNDIRNVEDYSMQITLFLNTLKHYSIKNTVSKSNILIILYILNNYTLKEIAELLIKDYKYDEFVEYVIDNTKDIKSLYNEFRDLLKKEKYIVDKGYVAKIFFYFYMKEQKHEMYDDCVYYSFLYTKDISYLKLLKKSENFNNYIDRIINDYEDLITIEKVYVFLNKKEELFNLLCENGNEYRLIENIDFLKDDYNDELYKLFKTRFFDILETEKSRDNYKRASVFISAINTLNNGKELVNEIISQLKKSKYSNRPALFEEINNVIYK